MSDHKILIIEDEPVHLNVMKAKLEHEGYLISVATDGEEGYKAIKETNPDLVLLDIILPKLNGFDVLEKVRSEGFTAPIIVVSNSGQPVEVDRALKLGANDYLVKAEFNPSDVLEKVEKFVNKPQRDKSAALKTETAGSNKKTAILVVEDDKFLRDLIVQKLNKEGFFATEAIDGEEGLKNAKEKKPDLILLDLILPGVDGFEVLRRLKADSQTQAIPVIVLSNLGQKEDMDRAIASGAEEFMVKAHFTPGEIISKIKEILNKKYF
ncbi:response regulator [Candidatus Giovannonibacteria bacterium]|nr:response regulator [Candidatus Giovannonibacteria bacterium]